MTAHTCHARGCGSPCPPRLLMCPPCWATVPEALHRPLYAALRAGRAAGDHPNGAWMLAADACIAAAAWAAGRPFPARWLARAMEYARAQDGDGAAEIAGRRIVAALGGEGFLPGPERRVRGSALADACERLWFPADGTAAAQAVAAGRRAREALEVRWAAHRAWVEVGQGPVGPPHLAGANLRRLADACEASVFAAGQWERAEAASFSLRWALPGEGEGMLAPPGLGLDYPDASTACARGGPARA